MLDAINPEAVPIEQVKKTRVFVPKIKELGYREIDALALLESCIRYGVAQFIMDFENTSEQVVKIRILEESDIKDERVHFDDAVVIVFGNSKTIYNPPILLKKGETGRACELPYGLVFFK